MCLTAGTDKPPLLQSAQCMTDWKQITARIRRARTGKDPAGQLSNLFQKTRDAMVAFELARFLEGTGQSGEAAKWYATAAERFRRHDWKSKAREAATRLSGGGPVESAAITEAATAPPLPIPEPAQPFEQTAVEFESTVQPALEATATAAPAPQGNTPVRQSRLRGRRGGRKLRGG